MEQNTIGFRNLLATFRGRIWGIFLVTMIAVGITYYVSLQVPPKYTSTATLIIDFDTPVESATDLSLAPALQPNYMSTQLGIISSRHVATKVVDRLGLEYRNGWQNAFTDATGGVGSQRDWIAGVLLNALTVSPGKNSRLVNVSYTAGNPAVAAELANAFAEVYQRTNLEMSTKPARHEAEQYQEWLRELRDKVAQAQQKLSTYQRENGILLVDERLDLETARLKELVAQRILSEADARASESKVQRIQELRANGKSLATLTEVLKSEHIRDLKGKLGSKEAEFAETSRQVGQNHPRYKRISAEVSALRRKLSREVESIASSLTNEVEEARSRVEAFTEAEEAQKTRVMELKQRRDGVPALVRELESAQANYDQGLARFNQFSIQSRASQTNVTLLNPALVPVKPSSPHVRRNVALAAALGLLLGIAIAVMRELLDRRIRTEEELEEFAEATFLGRLPNAYK
ncbi:MAG: Wzz/FepE/Etk N-terminal domain-containing protein [Chromatiales bacterium]|nr:Wzz/FepE/Etk N-terminal domain-containing protein [Chromatiales bacterium]